jgi:hypothetical protein
MLPMTDNVVKFPDKNTETVDILEEKDLHTRSLDFAYNIIHQLHDDLHEETGDCVFTDEEYNPLVFLLAETLSAIYFMSNGADHVMQEIAEDLFGDVMVDNDDEMGYSEPNDDNEE